MKLVNITPISPQVMRTRINKFIKLIVSHDASVCIAQEFLVKFAQCLFDKNHRVQRHLQDKLTPIIIRDVNVMLQNYQKDPKRVIREAFNNKNIHISHNKALSTRKNVSDVCLCVHVSHINNVICYSVQ